MLAARISSRKRARVVIAGGGFAALEAALALRALAADRTEVALVSPDPLLRYRPAAPARAFDDREPVVYDLRAIAGDLGAVHHPARLDSVSPLAHRATVTPGGSLDYDALVLAVGALQVPGIPGAPTFRDDRDAALIRRLLVELDSGAIHRLGFAVPPQSGWPVPLYELALLAAAHIERHGLSAELWLASPESSPLALFGPDASQLVGRLLEERGVRFIADCVPIGVRRDGALLLQGGGAVDADQVVAIPQLRGRRIAGVPARWWGFVPVDDQGRVEGVEDVFAAGDMTTFPIKQGGLATQQADRIAHTIAAGVGASVKELRRELVLRARLLGGPQPLFLRTELDSWGHPTQTTVEHLDGYECSLATKVFGRYLSPYLEGVTPIASGSCA